MTKKVRTVWPYLSSVLLLVLDDRLKLYPAHGKIKALDLISHPRLLALLSTSSVSNLRLRMPVKSSLPPFMPPPPLNNYHFQRMPWPAHPLFSCSLQKGISCRVPDIKGLSQTQNTGIDREIKDPGNQLWKRKEHRVSFIIKQGMKKEEGLGRGRRSILNIYISTGITCTITFKPYRNKVNPVIQ